MNEFVDVSVVSIVVAGASVFLVSRFRREPPSTSTAPVVVGAQLQKGLARARARRADEARHKG